MGKATNATKEKNRHQPLYVEIDADQELAKYGKVSKKQRGRRKSGAQDDDEEKENGVLDSKTSAKIIKLARDQQEELELRDELGVDEGEATRLKTDITYRSQPAFNDESDEDEDAFPDLGSDTEEVYEEVEIDPEDLNALDKFMPSNTDERRTLADIIFEKLQDAETTGQSALPPSDKRPREPRDPDKPLDPSIGVDPKVVEVYSKLGILLSRYRSGSLPKAFKIIPSLPAWARILALTRPDSWTPQAMYAATKILVSNLKPAQAQVFLSSVLLPAVRSNIQDNLDRGKAERRKLNPHYWESLRKGLYKPGAWFKGILFPLCEGGCTLREAAVVGSVLSRVSVPMLYSAAAVLRLAKMEYSGPNSLFIRILLDKKYALPYKVVDGLVEHFIILSNSYKGRRDLGESEKLPVLWHQSLLVFAQRYGADITPEQKDALLDVIRVSHHPQISPEIRRELVSAVARGEPRPEQGMELD